MRGNILLLLGTQLVEILERLRGRILVLLLLGALWGKPDGVSQQQMIIIAREVDAEPSATRLNLVLQKTPAQPVCLLLAELRLLGLAVVGHAALGDD